MVNRYVNFKKKCLIDQVPIRHDIESPKTQIKN